jgi:hypothetical protein
MALGISIVSAGRCHQNREHQLVCVAPKVGARPSFAAGMASIAGNQPR